MPRKKLIRRFEPRYGVSREMIETEAKYVAREFDDHLLLSTRDLGEKLAAVRQLWAAADQTLEAAVSALPERARLAIECMILRDGYHLYELYSIQVRASGVGATAPVVPTSAADCTVSRNAAPADKALPFSEWLFSPS